MWGKLTPICHNLSFGRLQSHFLWATDLWRPMATANDRQLDDAVEIDSRLRGMLQLRLEILQGKKRTYTLYIFIYTYTYIYMYIFLHICYLNFHCSRRCHRSEVLVVPIGFAHGVGQIWARQVLPCCQVFLRENPVYTNSNVMSRM